VATGAVEVLAEADEGGAFDGVAVADEAAGCCEEVELLWQPAAQNTAAGNARVAMINLRYMNFLLSDFATALLQRELTSISRPSTKPGR
jgi:hypothetical protein